MFDRLLLLAEGGYTVYSGPIVKRPQLIDTGVAAADVERPTTSAPEYVLRNWLEEMHIQCPAGFNLADYLIDLTKMGTMEAPLSPIDDQFDGSDTSAPVRNRKTTSSSTTHGSEIGSTSSSDGRSASPKRALRQLAYPTTHGFHLPIDPSDYAELAVKRPQIQTLVGGFFRSDVCLALKQEIEQQAASARTGTLAQPIVAAQQTSAMVPHPSSPSIVLETGEAAGDHDDMPLLAGNSSDGSSTLIETRSEPPAYEYLFPGLGNLLNSTWNMSAADEEASFRPSFWMQFRILSGRTFINFYRNPALMWAHYGMAIGAALLYGSVFWQVPDNIGGFQNRLGIFFFSFAVFGFGSLSSLALFVEERTLFMRERAGGYYTVTAYFLSKVGR